MKVNRFFSGPVDSESRVTDTPVPPERERCTPSDHLSPLVEVGDVSDSQGRLAPDYVFLPASFNSFDERYTLVTVFTGGKEGRGSGFETGNYDVTDGRGLPR